MSKPKSKKAAVERAVEIVNQSILKAAEAREPREDEKAPKAKTPRLSDSLKEEADRIIATREKKKAPSRADRKHGEPQEDLVVFAFRLTPEERELIHKAAGAAKASRFVRTLAVAAASGDQARIRQLLESASPTVK